MRSEVDAGSTLWRAASATGLFPQAAISLIRIGEQSGKLAENLKAIAVQEQKDTILRSKVKTALLYPVFVLTLTLVVGIGVAWFVLPRLAEVFSSLEVELPAITTIFIGLGHFLASYGNVAVPAFIIVLLAVVYVFFYAPRTKHIGQELLFKLPGVKKLIQEVELVRLGYLLGTLLDAGLPVVDALESLQQATISRSYAKFYRHVRDAVAAGESFAKSFVAYKSSSKLVPVPVQQMIVAAERSGSLSTTLVKIGQIYEAKSETSTKNLAIVLEPILLVIVWFGVLLVALAVILPLYSLLGSFNTQP
jgi:type II secretory pathway component PulF